MSLYCTALHHGHFIGEKSWKLLYRYLLEIARHEKRIKWEWPQILLSIASNIWWEENALNPRKAESEMFLKKIHRKRGAEWKMAAMCSTAPFLPVKIEHFWGGINQGTGLFQGSFFKMCAIFRTLSERILPYLCHMLGASFVSFSALFSASAKALSILSSIALAKNISLNNSKFSINYNRCGKV